MGPPHEKRWSFTIIISQVEQQQNIRNKQNLRTLKKIGLLKMFLKFTDNSREFGRRNSVHAQAVSSNTVCCDVFLLIIDITYNFYSPETGCKRILRITAVTITHN